MAWVIDFFVIIAISCGVSQLASVLMLVSSDFANGITVVAYFVVSVGYGMFAEWMFRGQTIGKRFLRLRVMDSGGLKLQFHQIVMRNLLRFVDMLPVAYLFGGISCLVTKRAQRLGDIAANTIVVHNPKHVEPDLDQLLSGKFNSLRQYPHLEARLRQRVTPDEARMALQTLIRRDELEPNARIKLFSELADHFRQIVSFPPEAVEAMPDEQYVHNVADILFRTHKS